MLGFENARKASYLVLATSAPVSMKQQTCSIPPRIFSYAVTILGRISNGLADIADQRTLLAYLSCCSRFTFISASEYFKMEDHVEEGDMQLTQKCKVIPKHHSWRKLQLKEADNLLLDLPLEQNKDINCMSVILQLVIDIWPSLKLGLNDEVTRTLRSLKAELGILSKHNHAGELVFALQYIDALERFARLWSCFMFSKEFYFHEWGNLEHSLEKLDGCLRDMRYKFIGLAKEDKVLIFELLLANCILTLCNMEACTNETTLKKLRSVMSHIEHSCGEGSTVSSNFVVEVQKSLSEIDANSCLILDNPYLLLKSFEHFTPKEVVLSGNLKYMEAELQLQEGNDFQNPLPFISGLPVGVSLDITLHNISSENRLWIKLSLEEKLTQFVFLDLLEHGHDEPRKFTSVAPFYCTPKANCFSLNICVVLECMSDDDQLFRSCGGPKHEVVQLCEEKEVYFSISAR